MAVQGYAVILVPSISHALRAEKALMAAGIPCRLIPVPRHLSSDCGVCLRVSLGDAESAQAVLEGIRAEIEGIHPL